MGETKKCRFKYYIFRRYEICCKNRLTGRTLIINKLHEKSAIIIYVRNKSRSRILIAVEEDNMENWIMIKVEIGFPMHPEEEKVAVSKRDDRNRA